MDALRWSRLQELFAQALAQPSAQRTAFIRQACGDDAALAAELDRLLAGETAAADGVQAAIARAAADWAGAERHGRTGQRLGPWRIVAHLADGGMGAVYRGERADGQYRQQVAIKLLNPAFVSADARARLAQERQILARLTHPHIARLLDGGSTDDDVPYLVMEFVDGLPIDAWCRERALIVPARLRLFAQVCRAVDHAHRNLVVHRDLKPSNILVDTEGAPRLLDFGIARLAEADAGVTASGQRLLTPAHASPEQITGGPITTASDIYALGVLLYDLLTGRLPHEQASGNSAALARAIVETEPPRPSTAVSTAADSGAREAQLQRRGALTPARLARELQGDLDNIVLMALRKEPDRRYASAADLAEDIERYLAHLPVRARPDTFAYRSAKFVRRHPAAVPASALAMVAALAAGAFFTWRLADERDRALASEARAQQAARFAASVLERTGALNDAQREVSVRDLLDRAAERLGSELADNPPLATRMRAALGQAYSSWGEYERSLQVLEPALAEARARGAQGESEAAELMLQLGVVTHDLGRLEESLAWTQQAETLLQRVGTPEQQARALGDVAVALNGLRRRAEAEPVFRQAIARLRRVHGGADHGDIAWLLNNHAWCLHAMGRLDEAQPLYEEALAMQQRLGIAVAEVAQTRNNLAGVHYDRGDLERAGREWAEVLAQYKSVFGKGGHAAVARGQNAVAMVAIDRGHFEEAEPYTAAALATNLKLFGERHRWTASTMQSRATNLLGLGRIDEAEALMRRVQALRRELLPPAHADHVAPLFGLARVALHRGRYAEAERQLRAARAVIASLTSPDRTRADDVDWQLARAVALQGRRDEGLVLARAALEAMEARLVPSHWRLLAARTAIELPPFVGRPSAEGLGNARRQLATLQQLLGPEAFAAREIAAALHAAAPHQPER